jgi:hypothetical protein
MVSKYEKYASAGKNNIEMDKMFVVNQVYEYCGSLCFGDGHVMMPGFTGVSIDRLPDSTPLTIPSNTLEDEDASLLKSFIEKKTQFTDGDMDSIYDSNSKVAGSLRRLVYHLVKEPSVILHSAGKRVKIDSEAPKSPEPKRKKSQIPRETFDDLLAFLDKFYLPEGSEGDAEEADVEIDDDAAHFMEFYGEDDAMLIPGADFIETSQKERYDEPPCLEAIVADMKRIQKAKRSRLNRSAFELWDKITAEINTSW